MSKMVLTFEADDWSGMAEALRNAAMRFSMIEPPDIKPLGELLAEGAPTPNNPATTLTQAPKPAKAATKKRPESVAPPPPPPVEPDPDPETEPAPPTAPPEIPTLEELKSAVTVAVRAAQKNGGPRKILDLLPGFKQSTGLDFVMNSKEEHRGALFDLVNKAGINVGALAAV